MKSWLQIFSSCKYNIPSFAGLSTVFGIQPAESPERIDSATEGLGNTDRRVLFDNRRYGSEDILYD